MPDVEVVPRHCTNISRTTTSSQLPYDVKYDFSLELYIILYYIRAGYAINTRIAHKMHGAISDYTVQSQIARCNLRFQFPMIKLLLLGLPCIALSRSKAAIYISIKTLLLLPGLHRHTLSH